MNANQKNFDGERDQTSDRDLNALPLKNISAIDSLFMLRKRHACLV